MKLKFRSLILGICLTVGACAQTPAGDARVGDVRSARRNFPAP